MWDVPEAFFMEQLVSDVKNFIASVDRRHNMIVIVEGILLFQERELNKLFDRRYFLTLPFDEAKRRRELRVYEPPDVPGLFDKHVWPMYEHYKALLNERREDMLEISGSRDIETVMHMINDDIKKFFAATLA